MSINNIKKLRGRKKFPETDHEFADFSRFRRPVGNLFRQFELSGGFPPAGGAELCRGGSIRDRPARRAASQALRRPNRDGAGTLWTRGESPGHYRDGGYRVRTVRDNHHRAPWQESVASASHLGSDTR